MYKKVCTGLRVDHGVLLMSRCSVSWAALSARMDPLNHCTKHRLTVHLRSEKPGDTDAHREAKNLKHTLYIVLTEPVNVEHSLCTQQRNSKDYTTTPLYIMDPTSH